MLFLKFNFLRHNAIEHLQTLTCTWKQNFCVTHFIVMFVLLWWSWNQILNIFEACL